MATPKKPTAKVAVAKKPAVSDTKNKEATGKVTPAKGAVAARETGATKAAAAVKSVPEKKAAVKAAPAQKSLTSPAKAAAEKKAAPEKKSISSKATAPVKKNAALVKSEPAAATEPAKSPAKKAVAPAATPELKETKKAEAKPAAAPKAGADAPPPVKKETKAEQRAAQKRTASAVQRVQAKVAAAIPKPQPKPAPMPTVMPGRDEKKSNVVVAHRRLESKPKEAEDNSMTMINYQPDFTRSILDKGEKETGPLYRYSDDELAEFRDLITSRLTTARKELGYQQGLITHKDAAGTDDSDNRYMNMEDGSGAMEREQLSQLASRQIQFINHLEKAMVRIENKTYGICRVTGKLIDKARLRAVPHATLSIEAKNLMSK